MKTNIPKWCGIAKWRFTLHDWIGFCKLTAHYICRRITQRNSSNLHVHWGSRTMKYEEYTFIINIGSFYHFCKTLKKVILISSLLSLLQDCPESGTRQKKNSVNKYWFFLSLLQKHLGHRNRHQFTNNCQYLFCLGIA